MSIELAAKRAVERIQKTFDEKKLNFTGKGRASIEYKIEGDTVNILGLERVLFVNFGRRPKQGYNSESWKEIYHFIEPWVVKKLRPEPKAVFIITKTIADKIQREGTRILKDRQKGLELEIVAGELVEQLIEEFGILQAEELQDTLLRAWQS